MKPERWRQIDQLLDAALELDPGQRAGFLDQACAGRGQLRREVESLLEAHGRAGSFIEAPALEIAAQLLAAGGLLVGSVPTVRRAPTVRRMLLAQIALRRRLHPSR